MVSCADVYNVQHFDNTKNKQTNWLINNEKYCFHLTLRMEASILNLEMELVKVPLTFRPEISNYGAILDDVEGRAATILAYRLSAKETWRVTLVLRGRRL